MKSLSIALLGAALTFVACNHEAPATTAAPVPTEATTAAAPTTTPTTTSAPSSSADTDAACCEDGLTWMGCCGTPAHSGAHQCGDPSALCAAVCAKQKPCTAPAPK